MQSEFERKRLRSRLSSSGSESEPAQPYYKQPKMTEITELMPPSSAADGDSGPVEVCLVYLFIYGILCLYKSL